MNTLPVTKNSVKYQLKAIANLIFAVLLVASFSVHANDRYQLKVLFTPSNSDLQAEANGRVMIYDSLKNETVEKAMNEQYERIDKMMFVRTQYEQENGDYETEGDDCD
jgi:hypothetical protein